MLLSVLGLIFSTGKTYEGAGIKVKDNAAKQTHLIRNNPANLKMSIIKTDWNSLLSPTSTLPPDVTFLVENEDEDGEQRGVLRKIGAHRFLLAGVSPVFNGMFNGPMKETAEEIKVVETTFEAFDLVIKYIYQPPGREPYNLNLVGCPQKLFELLTLSTKYQILDLATMTSEALEKLPLTKGTLIFAATVANNYKSAFDDLSSKLMMRSLKFFLDTTTGGGDVLALMKATEENFPEASLDILREARNVTNATLQIPGISAEPVLFLCTSIMYSLLI